MADQPPDVRRAVQVAAPALNFDDGREAFQAKSSSQLLQSLLVLRACSVNPFVKSADELLQRCRSTLGPAVTDTLVRHTFFKHFCAGECGASIKPTLQFLAQNGIRPILNYAAEDDTGSEAPEGGTEATWKKQEAGCDARAATFLRSVAEADTSSGCAFVAVKVLAWAWPRGCGGLGSGWAMPSCNA